MKTTNAKAKAFQTPNGPGEGKAEQTTHKRPSVLREKPRSSPLKTATSNPLLSETTEVPIEEREIEYMPPKAIRKCHLIASFVMKY